MAGRGTQRMTLAQVVRSTSPSLILSATSMLVACTCLGLLLAQSAQIHRLRMEQLELKVRVAEETDVCHYGVGRRTFLHLTPLSMHSYDEEDETLLKWTKGHSQGDGLKLSGETVNVSTGGFYFIYSQVLYTEDIYVMGHVIRKRFEDNETSLLKCMKSMTLNKTAALNTCYTAGVQYLESGSVVELVIPRKDAEISMRPHATFMGLYRL